MRRRFLFILVFTASLINGSVSAATLTLSPSSGSFYLGSTFTVNILLNTQGANTDGADIHYLNYPASLLEVRDANAGAPGIQISNGSLYADTLINGAISGRIDFSQTVTAGSSFNASGTLASVTFKVLGAGIAAVNFDFSAGSTTDTNVVSQGQDILSGVINGNYSVGGAPEATPPAGSILIAGGASYTVSQSVTLNLSASDASGLDQMQFSNDNVNWSTPESYATSKSWSLFSGDGLKTVYVKYKDLAGNWNTAPFSDTIILDTAYPTISNIQAINVSTSSATITWTTNEPSTSQAEYGITVGYGSQSAENSNFVTPHQITINNLVYTTLYHYRIISKDAANNQSVSVDKIFTTLGPPDTISPGAILGLTASDITQTSVRLDWISPGDDGSGGIANYYDIRYSTGLITEANWNTAVQVSGEPVPSLAGTPQSYTAVGLSGTTVYYFAIKTADEVPNISVISNVPSVITLALPVAPPPNGGGGEGSGVGDSIPPAKPSNVLSVSADQQIAIFWKNPIDADFVRVLVIRKEGSQPESRIDGRVVYEGNKEEYFDIGTDNSKIYYYAIYSYDEVPNYSEPAVIYAQPEKGKETAEKPIIKSITKKLTGDFNKDGKVNIFDLSILLSNWKKNIAEYDLNSNGIVNIFDLSILLSNWTK